VVSLLERLLCQSFPAIRPVDLLRCLDSDIEITALKSKLKSCVLVLDEMKGDLK